MVHDYLQVHRQLGDNRRMKGYQIAFDRKSARSFDADGRMHVEKTNLSKAAVNPYYGSEIPDCEALGLDPLKVYRMWRDPAELERGAATFNRLPVMIKHIQVSADSPEKQHIVGSIGSDSAFEAPYLTASICIWDAAAIDLIEADKLKELSCGYRYTPVMVPGTTPDGEAYDGRMTNIIGNHLALVEVGRAGPDVVVADSNPFPPKQEAPAMKHNKLVRAIAAAFSGSDIAKDAEIDVAKLDKIIDAVIGVEDEPKEPAGVIEPIEPVEDEEENGVVALLKSKGVDPEIIAAVEKLLESGEKTGLDEGDVAEKVEAEVKTAMDAMRAEFRALEQAKAAVRTVVGDVIGMDSAEQVYRFALDHLKVDHHGMPAAGLDKLFAVAADRSVPKAPSIATDSASAVKVFPALSRFNK